MRLSLSMYQPSHIAHLPIACMRPSEAGSLTRKRNPAHVNKLPPPQSRAKTVRNRHSPVNRQCLAKTGCNSAKSHRISRHAGEPCDTRAWNKLNS
jgi:hypothetical protein